MNKKIPSIPAIGIIALVALLAGTVVVLIALQMRDDVEIIFSEKQGEVNNLLGEKTATECQQYTESECPDDCIVCPPCEECSSLGCNSAEFCKSIGFDKDWYEMIKIQRETAGWQTYKNEEYGFEIKYPKDYVVKETEVSSSEENIPEIYLEGYKYEKPVSGLFYLDIYSSFDVKVSEILIYVYKANNFTVNEWIDYINNGVERSLIYEGRYISNRESFSIAGMEGIKGTSGCCGNCVKQVFFLNGNKIYIVALSGGTPGRLCSAEGVCKNCDPCCFDLSGEKELMFDQILSTFRFIE